VGLRWIWTPFGRVVIPAHICLRRELVSNLGQACCGSSGVFSMLICRFSEPSWARRCEGSGVLSSGGAGVAFASIPCYILQRQGSGAKKHDQEHENNIFWRSSFLSLFIILHAYTDSFDRFFRIISLI
jgi:hypothetical protein